MKILFCSSYINSSKNGAAIFAQLFLEWGANRNHQVDIISSEVNDSFIPLVRQNRIFSKIPILENYHRSFIYYKTIREQLKVSNYDLIFFNSVTESLHTAKLISNIPVHAFLHDENFMNDYMKQQASFKRRLYRKFMFRHEEKACHFLDKVWTNSQYMKSSVDEIYGIHPVKSDYFYFRSYDLVKYESKEDSEVRILFVKHDYNRGGLLDLIHGINLIKKYKITLEVIGPPKREHRRLRSLMKDRALEITEYRNRAEIQSSFDKANIFCVPSYSEALGLGNLEALSLGIPVISSNIPVMNELNKKDVFHMLPSFDAEDISNTILRVLEDKEQTEKLRVNGLKFVEEDLNKNVVFQKMDRIILA